MANTVQRLLERRAARVNEMRALAERAVEESRDMTAEENRQFHELNAEVDGLQERADAILAGEKRAQEIEQSFADLAGKPVERGAAPGIPGQDELRAFARGDGGRVYQVPMQHIEQRDTTLTSGAALVPTTLHGQIWEYMVETSTILGPSTLLQTSSGETITIPRVTAYSTATTTAEGVALTESDPTFSSVSSTVTKGGYLIEVTRELIDDANFDLQSYLARWAGRELGNAVGSAAMVALIAAASAGATGATGSATTLGAQATAGAGFDNLITLFYSVIAPYRNSSSCGWVLSDAGAAMVRKTKDSAGQYIWIPSVIAGQPDTVLGKPVYIDTYANDPAASTKSVLFGDLSSLYVRIAAGFRFERSDEYGFNRDVAAFRAIVRHGSVSVDANAVKSFVHSAT